MKVFISGPMKGLPNWNVDAFNEMEAKLKEAGYDVFNPAWLQFTPGWEHEEIIKILLISQVKRLCMSLLNLNILWKLLSGCCAKRFSTRMMMRRWDMCWWLVLMNGVIW